MQDRLYAGSGIAVPHQQYDHDFGNGATYVASIRSILNPLWVMREGVSRVT